MRIIRLAFLYTAALSAQEAIQYGSIGGRVVDQAGGVVPNAQVSVRQVETNLARKAATDAEGRFRFAYLTVGPYEIAVQRQGFAEVKRALAVSAGAAVGLPIALTVESTETNVVVSADAPELETARSQIAGVVHQAEVRALPLNGRNFLDLALLVPGVSPTNTASNQLFAETSAVPGQGISVGSQRNF